MPDVAFLLDTPTTTDRRRVPVALLGSYSDRRYGAFKITREQVDNWRRLLTSHFQGRVPIDEDHKTDKGISSEASGWITGLSDPDENGQVWGDVEWTPKGEAAVREKRYLYMSPTFLDDLKDEQGKSLGPALLRVALTNSPFLKRMPAISLSEAPPEFAELVTQPEDGGADSRRTMPDLTTIAKAVGLADDADEAKILEAITGLKASPETGTPKTLEQQAADAGKVLLSADQVADLTSKANAGEAAAKQLAADRFEHAFTKALDECRVDAKDETRTLYQGLYEVKPEDTLKLLSSLQPVVSTRPRGEGGHDATAPDGVDPESFRLNAAVEARMADKGEDLHTAMAAVIAEHERQEA